MSTIDPDYRGCDADRAMPFDITQIARQHQFFQNAMGASYSAVQSFIEEQERWRERLLKPSAAYQSILDRASAQQDLMDRYTDLISSSRMFEVSKYWEPSQTLSWLDEARRATESFNDVFEKNRKLLDQIASFTDPFLDLVERLKLEQIAPWASQMEATVEHVQRMLQSLPDDDDPEWDTLGSRLEDVNVAIANLPPTGATKQQIRALGITWEQWNALFWVLSTLLTVLTMLETHAQGRFAREQAAQQQIDSARAAQEERKYHEQLLAAIASLANHSPIPQARFVVGPREVRVKSAISKGLTLDLAYPNQEVIATGEQGRWIKIRYRNHLEERDVEGWVLKKYLTRQRTSTIDPGSDENPSP